MNILVIGNGFDIAHGLHSKYIEFLHAIEMIRKITKERDKNERLRILEEYVNKDENLKNTILYKAVSNIANDLRFSKGKDIQRIIELSDNNYWFYYFFNYCKDINETWIDFEKEIKKVCQYIEKTEYSRLEEYYLKIFFEENKITTYEEAINKLRIDLENLISALEIYIVEYIDGQPCEKISDDIYTLDINRVVSFNYSNTYQRVYDNHGNKVAYDYIHGRASWQKNDENNLVLGFDEYLIENDRNENMDFVSFKKYYQRVLKGTSNNYIEWIKEIRSNENQEHNLYIFGHSLDITDKDILKALILNSNVNTTIFYHEEKEKGKLIKNLIKVLEYDEFLTYTGENKIKFTKQKEMRMFSVEQYGDILRKLYNMPIITSKDNEQISKWLERKIQDIEEHKSYNIEQLILAFDAIYLYTRKINTKIYKLIEKGKLYTNSLKLNAKDYLMEFREKYVKLDVAIDDNFYPELMRILNIKLNNNTIRFKDNILNRLPRNIVTESNREHIIVSEQRGRLILNIELDVWKRIMKRLFDYLDTNIEKANEIFGAIVDFLENMDSKILGEYLKDQKIGKDVYVGETEEEKYLRISRIIYIESLLDSKIVM